MISKEQIQDQALVLFSKYGLKSVNMDDLAKELSVSKKTLYQVYSSKEDLVLSLFEKISSSWDEQVDEILESSMRTRCKYRTRPLSRTDSFSLSKKRMEARRRANADSCTMSMPCNPRFCGY